VYLFVMPLVNNPRQRTILLGAHMSIANGMHMAFQRGAQIGCATIQVFVKNNTQWIGTPLTPEDIRLFKKEQERTAINPVVAHAAYLINLCARDPHTLKRSRRALIDELQRCEALGITALIFHPGAHLGAGVEDGIKRIAESITLVHERTPDVHVLTTLECTAGQGTAVGYRFEHLRRIIDLVEESKRMAVCLDTCHVFAAGYNISTEEGWESTLREFDEIVGLERLVAVHVNDSRRECGARVDRHEHIGKGKIGLAAFRMLMNDPRLSAIPKILETPKSDDMHEDVENMRVLRAFTDDAAPGKPTSG
jgi:deoxyribonuclease-4